MSENRSDNGLMAFSIIVAAIAACVLAVAVMLWFEGRDVRSSLAIKEQQLSAVTGQYRHLSGWSQEFGQYQMFSPDSGKTWYQWIRRDDGGVTLIENLPLLKHVQSMHMLMDYVEQHGPIDISGGDPDGMKVLNDAGITVKRRVP